MDVDAVATAAPFELFDLREKQANDIKVVVERAEKAPAAPHHENILLGALQSLTGSNLLVAEKGAPSTVRVSAYTKEDDTSGTRMLVLHLVNYDVPIHGQGKSGPPVAVEGIALDVPLPTGWRAASVEALEPGHPASAVSFVQRNDRLALKVQRLSIYKILRIVCDLPAQR